MDKDRNQRSETILNITLEIIYLLTGEDCVIVSKTSGEKVTSSSLQLSAGWTRTQSSNMEPQSLIPERSNDLKILELTNKIIQLLTGEDQNCMEEHKENQQPLVSSDCTSEGSRIEMNIQAIKDEGVTMATDHPHIQCSYTMTTAIKEESGDKGDLINPNIQALPNHAQQNILSNIKEEPVSPKEEILTDTDIAALTDYTQPQSTDIKVISEEQSLEETDNCTSSGHTDIKYTNIHIKKESDTCGVENVTDAEYSTPLSETQYSVTLIDQIHQTQEKAFLCPDCGKNFKCKSSLVNHQKVHTEFSCSVCGKTFKKKSYLTKHQRLHTGEKPYSCVECGKCFISKSYLDGHQNVHRGEKPYSCVECGKCFISKSYLVSHHKVHTGEKPYSCVECGKCFIRKAHLVDHHKVHTGEKPYSCVECGKCLSSKSHLVSHHRIHTGEKPYCCVECGKCFINRKRLVTHHAVHTGKKPYFCSECGKTFLTKSNLIKHQMLHTRGKLFTCGECGKSFVDNEKLVLHQKIHTRVKPFSCSECEKCFTDRTALGRHLRTHTGEKPYRCDECGKRFAQKTNLLRHQKIH